MADKSLYDAGLKKFQEDVIYAGRIHDAKEQSDLNAFLRESGSPESALKTGEKFQDDAHKKWGPVKFNGKTKVDEKWITAIMSNIENFISVGDTVLTKAPESVSAAWFGISLALSAIQNNYALYSLFGSGLSDMTEMMVVVKQYDYLYHQTNKPDVKPSENSRKLFGDISDTYASMLDFAFSVHRHLSGSGWAQIRHGFKDFFDANGAKFRDKTSRMSECKKKVLEGSQGAFQEKAFQEFDGIQDTLRCINLSIEDIAKYQKDADMFYHAQLEMQTEWKSTWQEVKDIIRPRKRWDFALQTFNENKSRLRPLERTTDALFEALDRKLEGTCNWLFEHESYTSWLNSEQSSVLCITGPEGVGKSVLLASAFNAIDKNIDDSSCVALFISCDMLNTTGAESTSWRQKDISHTLIYQLYKFATQDENNPDLLERCNEIFANPKAREPSKAAKGVRPDMALPSITEALPKLCYELKKDLVIVLDAVDRLPAIDQDLLHDVLQEMKTDPGLDGANPHIRVLIGCRSGAPYLSDEKKKNVIAVEDLNRADIQRKLDYELGDILNWAQDERDKTFEEVIARAGAKFNYITQVAVPFLKVPFQGKLTDRLAQLPEGIHETYDQALRTMLPNYRGLLRCALPWTLLKGVPPMVSEIMDAFNGTYLGNPNASNAPKIVSLAEASWTRTVSELELEQLRTAAGPFLNIVKTRNGEWVAELQDRTQMLSFFMKKESSDEFLPAQMEHGPLCAHCKTKLHLDAEMKFSEKEGHLRMAITCVKTMSSAAFWSRYYIWRRDQAEAEKREKDDESTSNVSTQKSEDDANEGNGAVDDDYDSDDSKDDEDRGNFQFRTYSQFQQEEDQGLRGEQRNVRYELYYWCRHIREAESLCTPANRVNDPLWNELVETLDNWAFQCPEEFAKCQRILFRMDDVEADDYPPKWKREPWEPLHLASYLGLAHWTQHLIENKKGDLTALCDGRTPLQAAARDNASLQILRVLLEQGADPNVSTTKRPPPCLVWLDTNPSYECIELFKKHGADYTATDQIMLWGAMHWFALRAQDIRLIELLMEEDELGRKPNINAKDRNGETPLHILLRRRDVTLALLKSFIDHGADVNIDDDMSKRPLQRACEWASDDIVQILLPHVTDLNDDDKYGRTALHEAAWNGSNICIQLLLNADTNGGIEINRMDKHKRTPFFSACHGRSGKETEEAVKLLLRTLQERGFEIGDINTATIRGRTPLRQASARGHSTVVAELLKLLRCADENVKNTINLADTVKKRTALHCAAFYGKLECVRLLIESEADPSLRDKDGRTALQLSYNQWNLSLDREYEDIISILIQADTAAAVADSELTSVVATNGSVRLLKQLNDLHARLDRPDEFGWTPLMLSHQSGHSEAEEFLNQTLLTVPDKLPSSWAGVPDGVELTSGGVGIKCELDNINPRICICANRPIAAELDAFYFEVTLGKVDQGKDFPWLAVGFCTHGAAAIDYPGWVPSEIAPSARSWGYHADDGGIAASSDKFFQSKARRYGPGDTIGCGVDFELGKIWFTRNGVKIDIEFTEDVKGRLFPVVGIWDRLAFEANFGTRPFVWKDSSLEHKHTNLSHLKGATVDAGSKNQ